MLTAISDVVGSQPILALFLAIGLGYAVGQISILGFSLGIGAVLFVGLAIGAFAPKAQIAGPIGLIGLIMFLYGIGILYGRQFFEGLSGVGRKYNLLAFVAVIAGLLVALGLGALFDVQIGQTLGIFAGSMTSTATLQAALDVTGNKDPSIGYSVTYPFGVIGPILCFYFLTRRVNQFSLPSRHNSIWGKSRSNGFLQVLARSATLSGRCLTVCRSRVSAMNTGTFCLTPICKCITVTRC